MTEGFIYQEIGRRIRELRGKQRQKDWATKIGCDQGYISQVENGVTKPSLAFIKGVVSITGASIDWILTGRGPGIGEKGVQVGPYRDDTLIYLAKNPKVLHGLGRLLRKESGDKNLLEVLSEMDEDKVAGLAAFLSLTGK